MSSSYKRRLSPEQANRVLCGNAAELYGFDVAYRASHQAELHSA